MIAQAESEASLMRKLRDAPKDNNYRYTEEARINLLRDLTSTLANNKYENFKYFFPNGPPTEQTLAAWNMSAAQGAVEGAEYSAAARGKPCGHILKSGEATYRCKTCSLDETCVLCGKCFEASDHTGHVVLVSISPGNSGCCDCGDKEAWATPVKCAIHWPNENSSNAGAEDSTKIPEDLEKSIQCTIARAIDYICDVISCSPEQLRLAKTKDEIEKDARTSQLTSRYFQDEENCKDLEYALILWNDEKHTIDEVEDQVARACKQTKAFGKLRAQETDFMGRSIITYSHNIDELLRISRIIEQIKVTVTIRSARDTYREQMCGTIIEWLGDIAGCSTGKDNNILRKTICEELLEVWRVGSRASNTEIGKKGIDDHALEEELANMLGTRVSPIEDIAPADIESDDMDLDVQADAEADGDGDEEGDGEPGDMVGDDFEEGIQISDEQRIREAIEDEIREREPLVPDRSDDDVDMVGRFDYRPWHGFGRRPPMTAPGEIASRLAQAATGGVRNPEHNIEPLFTGMPKIPHTPGDHHARRQGPPAPQYWLEKPDGYIPRHPMLPREDLRQRVRLDWLILFDLRLWKKARVNLRDLYISTVVAIPEFKRILGLRFAGLYTILSQLYLIPDREPDHSIINLSLQILTTPSITTEVVDRGNFLTNLMAILYTFLTTRQVGHAHDVNKEAILAFDAGSLQNRRMFHFFQDMRYLFGSSYVQGRLRKEERYTLQFLDLVRLHQGICPNVRAVGEHVEYEVEAWISASLITREICKLARQFAEAFKWSDDPLDNSLQRTIATVARYAIVYSMGWERLRFHQAELKSDTTFICLGKYQFDQQAYGRGIEYRVVDYKVEKQPISFHHALHYTLSWLIEAGKATPVTDLKTFLMPEWDSLKAQIREYELEDLVLAMFDFPLRVCVWLSQMKAGMWVRNGFSLRHQMQAYRNVSQRDLTHNRDIFLLQTALVTIDPARMLINMVERFGLHRWIQGDFKPPIGYEEMQILDMAEDFLHLLIVLLSDRLPLIPLQEEPDIHILKLKREIVHILCFKPIQFSELCVRLPERLQDHEMFQEVLSEMSIYRAPEGLSDSGTFELKESYQDEVDPYIMQFSKNQREETESNYCARISKKTGQPQSEVVFEPKLRQVKTGMFTEISAFTRTPVFAQAICYSLTFALRFKLWTPSIQDTRVETFLQVCLHLCQLAVIEDISIEGSEDNDSFILHALNRTAQDAFDPSDEQTKKEKWTIVSILHRLAEMEPFKACHPKINNVLQRMRRKKPAAFDAAGEWAYEMGEKMDTEVEQTNKDAEAERKKQLAKERQAKIMAQMKQQQQNFLNASGFDFVDDDFTDSEDDHYMDTEEEQKKWWKYPTGTCILCQEEMNDSRLYGTLALVTDTNILRQTPLADSNYMYEIFKTPDSLDRPADDIRPFGVASMNRDSVKKLAADGSEVIAKRQGLGQGFPPESVKRGPVAVGCSHIMHFSCFEHYYDSTKRRHPHQIARQHPERLKLKEFICPLCKALGNAFLPIIWKSKEESAVGVLQPAENFDIWLGQRIGPMVSRLEKSVAKGDIARSQELFRVYGSTSMITPLANKLDHLKIVHIGPVVVDQSTPFGPGRAGPSYNFGDHVNINQILPTPIHTEIDELHKIYRRLRDTLKSNRIASKYNLIDLKDDEVDPPPELTHCDSLVRILGYTISSVEISQRGIGSEPGSTLLDKISQQVLTHLRILSETIFSYITVGGLQHQTKNSTLQQFNDIQQEQMQQLFVGHPQICDEKTKQKVILDVEPLLSTDLFVFLAECSLCLIPVLNLEVMHIVRLCYIAEIVKATVTLKTSGPDQFTRKWGRAVERYETAEGYIPYTDTQLETFRSFVNLLGRYHQDWDKGCASSTFPWAIFRTLVAKYTTPFLRKTVILLHTRYGILFPNTGLDDIEDIFDTEQSRLSKALGLPDLDEIFQYCLGDTKDGGFMRFMIAGWCRHYDVRYKIPPSLPHPSIFELVGLPLNFDTLVEEAMKRRCLKTGKDLTDPTVCLFCGEIFCSQAFCCLEGGKGGCNQHLTRCGKDIGLFINIRKCCVLYLHNGHGSFAAAPYLDKHGETDYGLRRNRQLFLNQRRYDALLRTTWLQHGIPSIISRKLEADINNGGWETM